MSINSAAWRNTIEATLQPGGIVDAYARVPAQAWQAYTEGVMTFMGSALSPATHPMDRLSRLGAWAQSAFHRQRPTWATPHRIVGEWPIARLRDFSVNPDSDVVPVLVLPPQAGHDSCVVDFAPGQSQVETIRSVGLERVAAMDWLGATAETKNTTAEDYLEVLHEAVQLLGGRVNLVGDCQGGWLAAIYAALHPESVHTLTIAGAPIDTWRGNPQIQQWLSLTSPTRTATTHQMMVGMTRGIYSGRTQLAGFKAMEPASEFQRLAGLLGKAHDQEELVRHAKFADWFEHTQDIPGAFYLWIVKHLFARNRLAEGTLRVAGERVDLGRIHCPIYMIAGDRDHITPPEQVWALEEHVSTDPAEMTRRLASAGHLGLFMGRHALQDHWAPVMTDVLHRSRPAS